ncbi:hypothetical protein D3C71_994520 [compost metagenome]
MANLLENAPTAIYPFLMISHHILSLEKKIPSLLRSTTVKVPIQDGTRDRASIVTFGL